MSNYRVYIISDDDKVASRHDLDCNDDVAAIAEAERVAAGRKAELWQLGRFIKNFGTATGV